MSADDLFRNSVDVDKEIVGDTISKRTSIRMAEAGINPEYSSHALRGAVANYLLKQGVPLERVLKIGGWTSLEVFLRFYYGTMDDNEVKDAIYSEGTRAEHSPSSGATGLILQKALNKSKKK
eukprot:TRINITY_DN6943_c1_g3_i7.p1 TRINITY_DN6943_c1_g3~~TRINITY_DN6943_c1_g3_i7.p1  ORF type:complete len:122 (-),score=10.31 TRINITY_DN6943_c1_g3_i7:19-384(-)